MILSQCEACFKLFCGNAIGIKMELYIGGMSQGKLKLVCDKFKLEEGSNQICDGADCSLEDLFTSPVINHLHLFIRRLLQKSS